MSGTVDTQSEISLGSILGEQWEMLLALYLGAQGILEGKLFLLLG